MPNSAPLFEIRDLRKSYGARAVLEGLDFEVERGEFASRLDIQRAVLDAWYEFARHERRMRRPDE